ncbi:phospholipid carrier-dependent glycosyltransferase [Sphingomonas sp. IC-11]|uniref:phospholipid carrier-dependent glycosyltransferase n=1 Tax=Sphingomonas sp. IC-11 TaxID=2898528 RepID=UPI001E3D303B|nr:phospholipid carrier-dependent glycosyltransferase [Sphingomonas sp. IC-11]MCD2316518.1 phospholipid carrier-dependent glycosyltransferase [Sphingomonas sp. IC-11]
MLRRPLPLAILLFALAEAVFLIRLAVPHRLVFDEIHYVPAARSLIALSGPANIEHPLLGKSLIALGMLLFGDTPVGWRFMSTLAGSATVVAMFATTWQITGRPRPALVAAALTLLNFTLYVQSRIAMLDGFMLAFLAGAIAMIAWTVRAGGWWRWVAASVLLGLAVGCKWLAAPYVAFAAAALVILKRQDSRRFPGLSVWPAVAVLGTVSVTAYLLTFAPAFFYAVEPLTPARLIPFQLEMFEKQTQVLPPHAYQSDWWSWPLLIRPIWYLYEPVDGAQRGILLLGNPAIMWGGLAAVLGCWIGWVRHGSPRFFAAAALWTASLGIWAVIPKSLGFYYYYFPSSIFIVLPIVLLLDHWRMRLRGADLALLGVALCLAIYFFPILSAHALPDAGAFRQWMWFDSWI